MFEKQKFEKVTRTTNTSDPLYQHFVFKWVTLPILEICSHF